MKTIAEATARNRSSARFEAGAITSSTFCRGPSTGPNIAKVRRTRLLRSAQHFAQDTILDHRHWNHNGGSRKFSIARPNTETTACCRQIALSGSGQTTGKKVRSCQRRQSELTAAFGQKLQPFERRRWGRKADTLVTIPTRICAPG